MQVSVKYLVIIALVFSSSIVSAQQSLMQQVDNVFLQKLIDTAKLYYPKMGTFGHRINIANEEVKKARASWFELLTFSLSYSPTNTTTAVAPTLSGFQVGVFFNIGTILEKPHNIKEAKEALAIAVLDKKEYNLNIEAEVKSRYYKYLQQMAVLKMQNESIVDFEVIEKQTKYRFEKGEETLENYSKAIVALNGQRQNIIAAEGFYLIAKSTLEEIIGKKLEAIH
jgi:outer membrane protein TolC